MPRYYRFGYQPYDYEVGWTGRPWPATKPAASTHGLGDVTKPGYMVVPPSEDPYLLHKAHDQRPPYFRVPESESPYYLHKYAAPRSLGASGADAGKTGLVIVAALAAAFVFLPELFKPTTTGKRKSYTVLGYNYPKGHRDRRLKYEEAAGSMAAAKRVAARVRGYGFYTRIRAR